MFEATCEKVIVPRTIDGVTIDVEEARPVFTYICDGCGKRAPADQDAVGNPIKPRSWYEREDEDGAQQACSRECVAKVAAATGTTNVILPF